MVYKETIFDNRGTGPLAALRTAVEVAKRDLRTTDTSANISNKWFGHWTLEESALDNNEGRRYSPGQTNRSSFRRPARR